MSEHEEQTLFFSWIDYQLTAYPTLALMHAIPNGAKLPWRRDASGKRYSPEAIRMKREGLVSGVPDVELPYPRGPYAGLWIEFKYGTNKPSARQDAYMRCLAILGYSVHICYDWQSATIATSYYLRLAEGAAITKATISIWKDNTVKQVEVTEKLYDLLELLRD